MLISYTESKTLTANRRPEYNRWASNFFALLAALVASVSLSLLLCSFLVSYDSIQSRLIDLYGPQRTASYFSESVWNAALLRIRFFCIALSLSAAGIWRARRVFARATVVAYTTILASIRHERRRKRQITLTNAVGLISITFVGLLLRLCFLNQPMRYDESATVLGYASKPLYVALSVYNEPNNHLFHTLLVHLAMNIVGPYEWAVRLPAFIAGSLLPVFAYGFIRRFDNDVSALFAAALVSTSSILIEYSTNARGYTIVYCATLVILIAGIETLRRASPAWFVVFGIASVLGFWTMPAFLIAYGGVLLWLSLEILARHGTFRRIYFTRLVLMCAGSTAATILLYLPPLAVSGPRALADNQWVSSVKAQSFLLRTFANLHLTWNLWNRDFPAWFAYVTAAAFFCSVALRANNRRLVFCLGGWVVLLLGCRHMVPFARNWLVFLVIFAMLSVQPIVWLLQRLAGNHLVAKAGPVLAVIASVLLAIPVLGHRSILNSTETGVLPSAARVVNFIAAKKIPPGRILRGQVSDLPLQYYWWRQTGNRPKGLSPTAVGTVSPHDVWVLLNSAYGESLNSVTRQCKFRDVRVIRSYQFDKAVLLHVTYELQQPINN